MAQAAGSQNVNQSQTKTHQQQHGYPNLNQTYLVQTGPGSQMTMKEQVRKDEKRTFGQSASQPPDSSTFYNYLQYKINHKEQHGTPQIPLNPVHSKAGSQKGSSMPRKEVMPGMPVNSA